MGCWFSGQVRLWRLASPADTAAQRHGHTPSTPQLLPSLRLAGCQPRSMLVAKLAGSQYLFVGSSSGEVVFCQIECQPDLDDTSAPSRLVLGEKILLSVASARPDWKGDRNGDRLLEEHQTMELPVRQGRRVRCRQVCLR